MGGARISRAKRAAKISGHAHLGSLGVSCAACVHRVRCVCQCGLHYDQNKIMMSQLVVLVETAKAFVDSMICNFNAYIIYIYI